MKKTCFILLFLILPIVSTVSQKTSWDNSEIINCIANTYNFSFQKADSCLKINSLQLHEAYRYFLILNEKWWYLVTTDNQKYYNECMAAIINGVQNIDNEHGSFHENNFLKICFESYKLRLLLYNRHYLRAYSNSKKVTVLIQTTFNIEKSFEPYYLTTGLYNYFGRSGKESYPFLFTDKNFKTCSKSIGVYYLETSAKSNVIFLSTEANYFLMKLYLEVEENPEKALIYSSRLVKIFGNNILYRYYHLNILLNLKRTEDARILYTMIISQIADNKELNESQRKHLREITDKLYKKKQKE